MENTRRRCLDTILGLYPKSVFDLWTIMICVLNEMLSTDKRNLIQSYCHKKKPKQWPSCSLHPPEPTETNKTSLTGGSNKNQIISTYEKLLLD